jgi:hypothetical protein
VPESLAPKISHLAGLDNLHATNGHALIPTHRITTTATLRLTLVPRTSRPSTMSRFKRGWTERVSVSLRVRAPTLIRLHWLSSIRSSACRNLSRARTTIRSSPTAHLGLPAAKEVRPYGEAILDIEYAHGIAPDAEIVLYAANAGTRLRIRFKRWSIPPTLPFLTQPIAAPRSR